VADLPSLLPRDAGLTELFHATWPLVDPTLAEDALRILAEAAELERGVPPIDAEDARLYRSRLPLDRRAAAEEEALRAIWAGAIDTDGLEAQGYLPRLLAIAGTIGRESTLPWTVRNTIEAVRLEFRVRKVLTAITDRVRAGELVFSAVDPRTSQRFNPDPALLRDLKGSDRSRSQIPTGSGLITHLRFEENPAYNPAQGELPLVSDSVAPVPPELAHGLTIDHRPASPAAQRSDDPAVIEETPSLDPVAVAETASEPLSAAVQKGYDKWVAHGAPLPTTEDDKEWAAARGISQRRVAELRAANPTPGLHRRGRRRKK
jgi:hypothetical protein